jgi:K+-transporting ATPase ATPase C chain
MRRQLVTALLMTIALLVLLGLLYPTVTWAVGRVAFPDQAAGSLVTDAHGAVVGSSLIGQQFINEEGDPIPTYFQPRPSAAGDGYDALASSGSNLGPSNPDLLRAVGERATAYRELNGLAADAKVPVDAVTASASGLDPHISVANARLQAPRVARERGLSSERVEALVDAHTQPRSLGLLGEKAVNVLELNLALDAVTSAGPQ